MKKLSDVLEAFEQNRRNSKALRAEIQQHALDGTLRTKDWNAKPANPPPPKDWSKLSTKRPVETPKKDWDAMMNRSKRAENSTEKIMNERKVWDARAGSIGVTRFE